MLETCRSPVLESLCNKRMLHTLDIKTLNKTGCCAKRTASHVGFTKAIWCRLHHVVSSRCTRVCMHACCATGLHGWLRWFLGGFLSDKTLVDVRDHSCVVGEQQNIGVIQSWLGTEIVYSQSLPPPAMVAFIKESSSSSPLIASWRWRGVILFTLRSFEQFPANSSTCTPYSVVSSVVYTKCSFLPQRSGTLG